MRTQVPYVPIDCALYDYLEIACLHRYEVLLSLSNASSCQGVATNTETAEGQEFLLVQTATGGEKIRLDNISSLQVITQPRAFERVDFKFSSGKQ